MTISQGFLSKKGGQWRKATLLQLAVLLLHVHKGAQDENVGFEDAQETLDTLTGKLNKHIMVDPALLESALWSANLRNEKGDWWHPKGYTFDEFVKQLLGHKVEFNRDYNVIEDITK